MGTSQVGTPSVMVCVLILGGRYITECMSQILQRESPLSKLKYYQVKSLKERLCVCASDETEMECHEMCRFLNTTFTLPDKKEIFLNGVVRIFVHFC